MPETRLGPSKIHALVEKASKVRRSWNWASLLLFAVLITQLFVSIRLLIAVNELRSTFFVPPANVSAGQDLLLEEAIDVSADDDPVWGPDCAPITIVEFSDYECFYCARVWFVLEKLREQYGDQIRIVFRNFPLDGEGSLRFKAAEAAECADEQGKFLEMHRLLFERSWSSVEDFRAFAREIGLDVAQFEECLESGRYVEEIRQDQADGLAYGVMGTPTVFLNGRQLMSTDLPAFEDAIDRLLATLAAEGGGCPGQDSSRELMQHFKVEN